MGQADADVKALRAEVRDLKRQLAEAKTEHRKYKEFVAAYFEAQKREANSKRNRAPQRPLWILYGGGLVTIATVDG